MDKEEFERIKSRLGNLPPTQQAHFLSLMLGDFIAQHGEQFHLKIPTGTLPRIDRYRDYYLFYLKDSVFKSNISYLLQWIDFQIWIYKTYHPSFSLENAFFLQLMVAMGMIAELIAIAILLNPLIESSPKDRSSGKVKEAFLFLAKQIQNTTFRDSLQIIAELKILTPKLMNDFNKIRTELRNLVHLQNWSGRLYQSLSKESFQKYLYSFRKLIDSLKNHEWSELNAEELLPYFEPDINKIYLGSILSLNQKGYGFVQSTELKNNLFFHFDYFSKKSYFSKGTVVKFKVRKSKRKRSKWEAYELTSG